MWVSFAIACLVGLFMILIPGALVLRSLRFSPTECIVYAAPLSAAFFAIAGVFGHALSLYGAIALVLITLALVGILSGTFVMIALKRRSSASGVPWTLVSSLPWGYLALYVVVNGILMAYLFLRCLDSPEAIIPIGDGNYHVAVVQSMMDSGDFSTLSVTPYPGTLPENEVPFDLATYYPAAWHVITALIGTLADSSAALAENASDYLFTAFVFPLGVLALLRTAFPEHRNVALFGAIVACACVAFPLRPLLVHQIYPTIAGFACIPAVVALFLGATDSESARERRIACGIAFFIGLVGLGVLHPGAFLACAVFVFAIIVCGPVPRLARKLATQRKLSPNILCVALVLAWTVIAAVVWMVVLNLPALASVTDFLWDWTISPLQALYYLLTLGLRLGAPQWALALVTVVGAIRCLRHSRQRWAFVAAALFGLIFFAGAIGTPEVKHLFAGFWYTDPERTSCLVAIAIVPLAAAGLGAVFTSLRSLALKVAERGRSSSTPANLAPKMASVCIASLLAAAFVVLDYFPGKIHVNVPGFGDASGFVMTRGSLFYESDPENSPLYTADEEAFVQAALELIGDEDHGDALLLNMPHDGSLYAYPLNQANVYYKSYRRPGAETDDSHAIRTALDEIAVDATVRDAVRNTGAEYVLVLNHEPGENYDSNAWSDGDWTGFDSLNDETPGFEVALADGDMRLYRITALD